VVAAWPGAGRLEEAGSLLPERALSGDVVARDQLIARIHRPLTERPELLDTARALLEHGGGIEATSRNLFVHANTLRYRLRTIERLTGCDLGSPRHRFTAQVALALGALADR
jgi:DNA-binding PucR family transcriptional regulator